MSSILTAEEFLISKSQQYAKGIGNSFKNNETLECERLIEFAKFHVKEALKQVSEKAEFDNYNNSDTERRSKGKIISHNGWTYQIDKESILNAYPLENIK